MEEKVLRNQPPADEDRVQVTHEETRLRTLQDYCILDTPPEADFDNLTKLAARLCGTPIALVSLVDRERQWFKARVGLEPRETPRDWSFCAHALMQDDDPFVVTDAQEDPRFRDNPLVTGEPRIRFYAGATLRAPNGERLGTLCVIDTKPRVLEKEQEESLRTLASQVVSQLELRRSRRAEQEARKSAEAAADRLKFLTDTVPLMAWSARKDGRVDQVNRRVVDYFGLPSEQYSSLGWSRLVHPDEAAQVATKWAHAMKTGESLELEVRLRDASGDHRWHMGRAFPVRDAEGNVQRWYGTFVDIEDRKRGESSMSKLLIEVEEHRRRLDNIIASVPGVVWETWKAPDERAQRIDFVSDHVETMLGYTPEEWLSAPDFWLSVIHPDDREKAEAYAAERFATGTPGSQRFRWRRKDGDYRWVQAWNVVVHDHDNRPIGMRGVTIDITEQKKAEDQAAELKRRLELILESVGEGIFEVDHRGCATFVNPAAARILGYEASEILGQHPHELFHDRDAQGDPHPVEQCPIYRVAKTGESYHTDNDTFWRKDGRPISVDYVAAPLMREGRPSGVVVAFTDVTESLRAEDALRESEERHRFLAENSRDMIRRHTPDGRYLYVSPAVRRILGYEPEELVGRSSYDFIHPEDLDNVRKAHGDILDVPDSYTVTMRYRRKDGAYVWLETVAQTVRHPETGEPLEIVSTSRDVTDRKEAEEALRESEERYRFLSDTVPEQVWTALPDGRLDYVNRRMAEYLGRPEAEILGEGWQSAVHPDDLPEVLEAWTHSIETGEDYEAEFRLFDCTGRAWWHVGRAVALRNDAGEIVKWFGANTDISDVKEAQEALEARARELSQLTQELRYRDQLSKTITDNAASSLFMVDTRGYPVFMNAAAQGSTGFTLDEIRDKPLHDSIHHLRPDGTPFPMEECPIDKANDRIVALRDYRDVFVRKDGTLFPVNCSLSPIEHDGQQMGAVMEFRDISEQLRAEDQLRRRADELAKLSEALQRSNRELDQFAYVTSHDLKAPLRGIANLSTWIEEDLGDAVPEDSKEHLELLRGRVNRMEALIDAILEYSRVGRIKSRPENVDVGKLVEDVADLLSPPEGFRIEVEGKLPSLVTEKMRLHQVFMNLVSNAVKHHHDKPNGLVQVRCEDAGDYHKFIVSDNGPGISPRFHDKVFVIFQTLEARDKVEGTGIGLALVKKIVESQGGTITLESDEGRGATFAFTWPKRPVSEEEK